MSAITPKILDVDVGRIWFGREAVVANVDTSVRDSQTIDVERVEAICVLGESLARVSIPVDRQNRECLQKHCC